MAHRQNIGVDNFELARIVSWHGPVRGRGHPADQWETVKPEGSSHWHLQYTVAGVCRVAAGDGSDAGMFAAAGEAVLMRPGTPWHLHEHTMTPRLNINWVQFHPRPHWEQWLNWPEVLPGIGKLTVAAAPVRNRIFDALERVVDAAQRPSSHWEEFALAAFEEVLIHFDTVNPASRRVGLDERVARAEAFLVRHLEDDIALADLAAVAGVSVSHLGLLFRSDLGMSPLQYLDRLRISRACYLFDHTGMRVNEVATALGFRSPFYFSRRFRRRTGMSPSAYRRRRQCEPQSEGRRTQAGC